MHVRLSRTEQDFRDYISRNYLPGSNPQDSRLQTLFDLYPSDPVQGSPFDTGDQNLLHPQFKRLAAIQGDLLFQAQRRFFLAQRAHMQPTWSYCMLTSFLRAPSAPCCAYADPAMA